MKSKTLRIVLGVLIVAGVAAMAFAQSGESRTTPTTSAEPIASLRSATPPEAVDAAASVRAIGTIASANQASLAFQMAGRVKSINIKEGDAVHAGDVLVSLDTTILDLQVVQAQAALETAQARLEQLKNPSPSDVTAAEAQVAAAQAVLAQVKTPTVNDLQIAKADLDMAQASLNQAQAAYDRAGGATNPFIGMTPQALALQQASDMYIKAQAAFNARTNPSDAQLKQAQATVEQTRAQLTRLTNPSPNDIKAAQAAIAQSQAALDLAKQNTANARIVAPFDGTVVWVGPHLGESATPNVPIVSLADLQHMQVQIGVDEHTLALLSVGQTASIKADALPGKTFSGRISRIGLLATSTAGIINLPVTIDMDPSNGPIAPGLSATIEFNAR